MSDDEEIEILKQLQTRPELFQMIESETEKEFRLQKKLREHFPTELVRAALTLHELRQRAKNKFSLADQLWFDRKGLEQSTAERVAQHKAQRFAGEGQPVYDLCSGMGADAIAIAQQGRRVICVDRSALACYRAQLNAAVSGVADRIETRVADVSSVNTEGHLIHFDPDRRSGRTRAIRLEEYEPSLEFLQEVSRREPGGAIKLSPASNFGGKFPNSEIELISLDGECKEATVWFGSLAGEHPVRATILPANWTISGNPAAYRPRVSPLQRYIYDPDPAVVRAGLIDCLTAETPLRRLDDTEEYLTCNELYSTPATTAFEVIQEVANSNREIRNAIRAAGYGEAEIKSRHVPIDADAIRKKLPLTGQGRVTLFYARLQGKTRVLITRRCSAEEFQLKQI